MGGKITEVASESNLFSVRVSMLMFDTRLPCFLRRVQVIYKIHVTFTN